MNVEVLIPYLLTGTAIGIATFAVRGHIAAALDLLVDDLRGKLKRLRIDLPPDRLRTLTIALLVADLLCFFALWWLFRGPWLGGFLGIAVLGLPWYAIRRLAERRRQQIEDQLADAMVSLSSAIRAGLSLAQALEILAQQSPYPLRYEFRQIVNEYRMGKPLEVCLDEARRRLRSENFALFAAAMQASRASGGKLNETVERIAHSVRELQRLERKILAETAQARSAAFYMAITPFAILAIYYFVVDQQNTVRLFTTFLGQMMLATAALLNLIAYLWARRILNPEI
ncbi:MAG: hypothetical protein D6725_06760 [Planctomycetota bacterium]|nr:MAG: hypothetical protein D6725_06760 [Planctomycetota bacterium]